jgi:LacI family transcriptional regulator
MDVVTKDVTIKEVAKAAGVSTATVSRVLNESKYIVSDDLRNRVIAAASKYNYTPNLIGRQLKSNTSKDIGVIVPSLINPFYPVLLSGVEQVAKKRGYNILLYSSGRDANSEIKYLTNLYQKRVAGIILSSISGNEQILDELTKKDVKIVTFDQNIIKFSCSKVYINSFKTGQLGTEYLISLNHRNIAFISSPLNRYSSRIAIVEGYKSTMKEHDIRVQDDYLQIANQEMEIDDGVFEFENGKSATKKLLMLDKPPTAIFCNNDMTAYGCIKELQDNNIRIPEDISVMGANDFIMSSITSPSLTTINLPMFQMGKTSAEILIDKIENIDKVNKIVELEPRLVIRNSTNEYRD